METIASRIRTPSCAHSFPSHAILARWTAMEYLFAAQNRTEGRLSLCFTSRICMGIQGSILEEKESGDSPTIERLKTDRVSPPQVPTSTLRQVEGVIAGGNREVLDRCAIGWCKSPISNSNMARALQSDNIVGLQVMRISGDRVLLIFDDACVRSKMLASDTLSTWFDRVVEWNEEDGAMGCRRVWMMGIPFRRSDCCNQGPNWCCLLLKGQLDL
ncbi:hypothetical protein V6N11_000684 [Hibiscus sabdariffa]|uniref:Uncharacterized protein n=1 Tax=Hibiscus sabdariffa TaxID=183260 RepID=A0ABR2RY13_9ROSI